MHPLTKQLPPIAMLHYVSNSIDDSLKDWCITHKSFLQFLDHLETNDYQTIHFADIAENKHVLNTSSKKVILTFDDCPRLLFDFAVPELLKRNMKAVFFIPTADIGGCNSWDVKKGAAKLELMNEADLKELSAQGQEIGSHSHHHIQLKNSSSEQLKKEAGLSKTILESIIKKKVYSFSYPYGSVPPEYKSVLSEAGYRFAVSIYQPFETVLALRRFGVYDKDTTTSIKQKLSLRYKLLRSVYDVLKKN